MLGGASDVKQQYADYCIAQQFVYQQLIIFCNEFEQAQKLKEKAIRLSAIEARQKQQKRVIYWEQFQYFISSLTAVSLLIILGSAIGIFIGINVPNGAACHRKNLPCRWFRLREPTTIISLFDNDI